ncbi:MAG: hypothetical protein LBC67_06475 [Spirochaetales bacterium]|nr:hypothetical protein [Spirochaetales bacterium]
MFHFLGLLSKAAREEKAEDISIKRMALNQNSAKPRSWRKTEKTLKIVPSMVGINYLFTGAVSRGRIASS